MDSDKPPNLAGGGAPRPLPPARGWRRLTEALSSDAAAWSVLTVALALTLAAWVVAGDIVARRVDDRFLHLAERERGAIVSRMATYDQVLRGGVALFESAGRMVSRDEWRNYARQLELERTLPGIQGMGFALMIAPERKAAHEAAMRAQGFPDYAIAPEGERDQYSSIVYLEPFADRNLRAFGYDMYSEPVRREAMARARDTGRTALSGKVTLLQETGEDRQPGFLMYRPVYRAGLPRDTPAARRAALLGYVYSPFRSHDLMRSIIGGSRQDTEIEIFDGAPGAENLLFDSAAATGHRQARYQTTVDIDIGGHRWTARFSSRPEFERLSDSQQPLIIAAGGLAFDAMLFLLLLTLRNHRRRLEAVARELQESRERLHTLAENVPGTVFRCEVAYPWRVHYISRSVALITGEPAERFLSGELTYGPFLHPEDLARVKRAVAEAVALRQVYEVEYRLRHRDGSDRWVAERGQAIYSSAGEAQWVDGVIIDITEHKLMAMAREEMEERYRHIVETANEGIWSMDSEHRTTYVNQAMADMLGYRSEDMLGRTVESFMFAADLDDHRQQMRGRHRGQGGQYERRFRRRDGSECWCLVSATAIRDPQGGFAGSFAMFSDITDRKHVEADLAARESLLQQIMDTSSVAIFLVDRQGRITHANRRMGEMFGCPQEALIGSEYVAHVHPAERELGRQKMLALLGSSIASVDLERRYCRQDGSEFWGRLTGRRFRDVGGQDIGLVGVIADITERRLVEDELRVAATAFESLEGIIVTDVDGVILRVNPAFSRVTGYAPEEVIGRTPAVLRSGRQDSAFYTAMWSELRRQGRWQGELWNRRKDGQEYPEWLTITAVKDAEGLVTHYVGIFQDITERKAAEEEIRSLAFFDPLTHLPNRRLLQDRLQHATAASGRHSRHGALLFLDLDNFKTLNDTLGHDVGDLLLVEVARRLQTCVRDGDTVARLGGDEFVVIVEELSLDHGEAAAQAQSVGEKIIAALDEDYRFGERHYRSTPSIGITLFRGRGTGVEDLLKQADLAMYQAKAGGRNTLRFFDPEMQTNLDQRAVLEDELHRAVAEGQFVLRYQPQVDRTGRCTGVEALLRWQHPRRGLLPPAEFISLAEDTGLILPIGHWVLRSACMQLAAWRDRPALAGLRLAVNISARQFRLPVFAEELSSLLAFSGAPADRLELELTESILLADVADALAKMTDLRALGVGFALDDFGTGYSSLAYLRRLPLDQVKIDISFVREVLTDVNDAAICRAVIALGRSLDLTVLAEGVETAAQWDFLAAEGCHGAQGTLYAGPMEGEQLANWLAARPEAGC